MVQNPFTFVLNLAQFTQSNVEFVYCCIFVFSDNKQTTTGTVTEADKVAHDLISLIETFISYEVKAESEYLTLLIYASP